MLYYFSTPEEEFKQGQYDDDWKEFLLSRCAAIIMGVDDDSALCNSFVIQKSIYWVKY